MWAELPVSGGGTWPPPLFACTPGVRPYRSRTRRRGGRAAYGKAPERSHHPRARNLGSSPHVAGSSADAEPILACSTQPDHAPREVRWRSGHHVLATAGPALSRLPTRQPGDFPTRFKTAQGSLLTTRGLMTVVATRGLGQPGSLRPRGHAAQ